MLLTPTQISVYTSITGTPTQAQIDSVVRAVNLITNNYFVSDLCIETPAVFAGSSGGTITIVSNNWNDWGFADGDTVYVHNSYRNDGYKDVSTVITSVMTLVSTSTAIAELSGRTIYFSVVQWPEELKPVVAKMVAYDVDSRDEVDPNVKSKTIGPWSESYETGAEQKYGYPSSLTNMLDKFRVASLR